MADAPQRVDWCRVGKGGLHPATHPRTHLCDQHHAEYQLARDAWRARVRYHAAHKTTDDPGEWVTAEANIEWSSADDAFTALGPEQRGVLRTVADRTQGVAALLHPFVEGDAYLDVKAEDFRAMAGVLQAAIAEAVAVMRTYGMEPD